MTRNDDLTNFERVAEPAAHGRRAVAGAPRRRTFGVGKFVSINDCTTVSSTYFRLMLAWMSMIGTSLLKPAFWFEKAGSSAIYVVTAMIFAESGLLVGFFLPGDSLLFFTGFLTSAVANKDAFFHPFALHVPSLPIVLVCVFLAAVARDQVGYLFGRRVGPALFRRPTSRLFNPDNVARPNLSSTGTAQRP